MTKKSAARSRRAPGDGKRTCRVAVRYTPDEVANVDAAAAREGMVTAAWLGVVGLTLSDPHGGHVAGASREELDDLVDATEKVRRAGVPRAVLANLESGRRDVVTVAEILVLAAALDVTPTELFCPVGFDEEIELLPGRTADPLSGSQWVNGQLALDLNGPELGFQLPPAGQESNARLAEQHADLLEQVRAREAEVAQQVTNVDAVMTGVRGLETIAASVTDQEYAASVMDQAAEHRKLGDRLKSELASRVSAADKYREVAAQSLRYIRAEMHRRGMLLPPLPPLMKDIDGKS